MTSSYKYVFPAILGHQAGREYYVAMCPLSLIPKIFLFNEDELPPDLRAQRTLNKSRIPDIRKYILNNPDDYAFSAITASIDGDIAFHPTSLDKNINEIGQLEVSMDAKFLINDGQHRRAAIEEALMENPELGNETIAVVFYTDENLERSKQLFADLNKHAVKPSKSLNILYDYRDPLACLVRELISQIPIFKGLTEKEKTTISNRSIKLFTLSGIYQGTKELLGKRPGEEISDEETRYAGEFWKYLGQIIPEWKLVVDHKINTSELRRDYIHSHNVTLVAFGSIGNDLFKKFPNNWKNKLKIFQSIDWSRDNYEWEGRAMVAGRMSRSSNNVKLTTILLKRKLGLQITSEDKQIESEYLQGKEL